jgi:hypothetical protein
MAITKLLSQRLCKTSNSLRVEDRRPPALRPGDDAEAAARKILRESHGRHGSFYDPIHSQNVRFGAVCGLTADITPGSENGMDRPCSRP